MKKLVILPTLLIIVFFIASCTDNANKQAGKTSTTEPEAQKELVEDEATKVEDTISVATFNTWAQNWDTYGKDWLDTAQLTAFNVPIADLSQTIDENAVSSRFYLGLEAKGSGYIAKTMIVGVNDKDEDMIDYANGLYIYDLTRACPPFCGKKK